MSLNTLLPELARELKLPIWNRTWPLVDPKALLLTAERVVVVEGQNHTDPDGHMGIMLAEGDVKKNPFEPLSMMLG